MEAFNIAVGVSNIVNCATAICTLGIYRKNEPCKLITHLKISKDQLLIAWDDLARFANVLDGSEYKKLENDCHELRDTLSTNITAAANANYFIRRQNFKRLLKNARTLEEDTYDLIAKIRGKSAAAIAQERQKMVQREGSNVAVQTTQSVNNREQDSNKRNPFSDEATTAWQGHGQSA